MKESEIMLSISGSWLPLTPPISITKLASASRTEGARGAGMCHCVYWGAAPSPAAATGYYTRLALSISASA